MYTVYTKCSHCGKTIKTTIYEDNCIVPVGFEDHPIDEGICNDCYRAIVQYFKDKIKEKENGSQ